MADRSKSRMKVVVSKDAPPPPIPESGPVAAEMEDEAEEGSARWIWLALGGAAVLALGLAAWHYVTLYTSVDGARSDLVAVEEGLTEVGFAAEQSDLDEAREQAERGVVLATLRESGFNVSECARRLRVSRVTVYRLCKKHQLELELLRT